jgi:hypothetical protein
MKPGEQIELAIWLTGTETPEHIKRFKEIDAPAIAKATEQQNGVAIGPLRFTIKKPGDDRVPKVPDHIKGPDVRLLVCEAETYDAPPSVISVGGLGFIHDLTPEDLARLRKLTRRAHAKVSPGDRLSDKHCDTIIESLGPDVAVRTLRDDTVH